MQRWYGGTAVPRWYNNNYPITTYSAALTGLFMRHSPVPPRSVSAVMAGPAGLQIITTTQLVRRRNTQTIIQGGGDNISHKFIFTWTSIRMFMMGHGMLHIGCLIHLYVYYPTLDAFFSLL